MTQKSHSISISTQLNNYKIIVVEDDGGLSHLIQKKLKRKGFKTATADSGAQTLSVVKGEPNELLLLDYKLPDMNGKQLVELLQKKYGRTPHFIIMTGFGDEKIAVEMMKLGALDYLVKDSNLIEFLPNKIGLICEIIDKNNKLEENRKLLYDSERLAGVGGWVWDIKNDTWRMTENWKKIHGYSQDTYTTEDLYKIAHPDDRKKIERAFQKSLKTGKPYKSEHRIIRPNDNEVRFIRVYGEPQLAPNGEAEKVVGAALDITDWKKTEEKIKSSEERLKILFEYAPNAIFLKDMQSKFLDGNQAVENLLGYSREELANQNLLDRRFIEENDLDKATIILKLNEQGKESEIVPLDLKHKNGSIVSAEVKTYPITINGETLILGIAHDTTERKKATRQLQQSEERYRNIFENMQDVYYEVNMDGMISEMSPSIHYFSSEQYSREDLIGKEASSLYKNPSERDEFISQIQQNGFIHDYELAFLNKDGSEIICSVTARLKMNENGQPEKIIGNLHNITERKKIETELISAKEKAEESDRLKSAFLANMSHEIRTPMNGIFGFIEMLKEPDVSGDERESFISIIQKSGKRMLNTLNDLIDISRIETGQVEMKVEPVNITKELNNLYLTFEVEANSKNLEFRKISASDEPDIFVNTDRTKFNSVVSNLIKNAVKYTEKGNIEIGCTRNNRQIEIVVKDTGIGIPKQLQKNIFDRFVQAEQGYTRDYEGAGLGLSISKAYAEMLGGDIRVESEEGEGSTFVFSHPLNKADITSDTPDKISPTPSKSVPEPLRILIVEDDDVSRLHLEVLLKKDAKELLFAQTGREAVEICKNHPEIELVLMDIKMPDMDGFEATRKIRAFNKSVVIIAQTAYALSGDEEKTLQAGCNDYISKPIKKSILFHKISKLKQS